MTPATTARTSAAATSTTTSWQMWVPCLGMALCSWLSFVDRQVLNILSPTIIADTGLTPQDFTTATSFFFLTYTLGNPVWGSVLDRVGLRIGMLLAVGVWTAASMSHALMVSFAGFALARSDSVKAVRSQAACAPPSKRCLRTFVRAASRCPSAGAPLAQS
jgi:ACS family hexuronate transporter-like MFS transporter